MKENEMFMKYSTVCVLNPVQLFAALWTRARQAPLSLGFSRQEYWSGLPWPPLGDLLNPGIKPISLASPALQVDALPAEPPGKPKTEAEELDLTS